MFETTVVETRIGRSTRAQALTLPVSIGLHAAVIATGVMVSVWNVSMPTRSPSQMASFIAAQLPQLPAEPRPVEPPSGPEPTTPDRVEANPPLPSVEAPPNEIPNSILNLTPGESIGPIEGPVNWDWAGKGDTGQSGSGGGSGMGDTGPHIVGVGGATRPITIKRVQPVYPPILVKAKLRGSAIVECVVEEDGRIRSASVVSATHALFGESARDAVLQWKFLPGRLNGEPVATIFHLTVEFEVLR